MGRKAQWPPRISVHQKTNLARVFYRGQEYPLGRAGTPAAQSAYAALLTRLLAEGLAPGPTAQGPSVAEVVALWTAHAEGAYSHDERREYERSLAFVVAECASLPAARFGAAELDRVRDRIVLSGNCQRVVNRRIGRIRTAWRWAERRGHVPPGSWGALRALPPLSRADRRAPVHPPVRPVAWEAVCAVARELRRAPRGLLLTLWFSGARPGELFSLTVAQALAGGGELVQHKNAWRGQSRRLVFGQKALAVLRPLCKGRPGEALVFPNANGIAFNRNSFRLALNRAADRAGVARLTAYQNRHAAATRVAQECGLEHARALLGHASVQTTGGYVEVDGRLAVEAARRCG